MPDTWMHDARDLPDAEAELRQVPGPALNLALFLHAIIAWVTSHPTGLAEFTNVSCRRRPGGLRCLGTVEADIDEEKGTIEWDCPACGDRGSIGGWTGRPSDRSGPYWMG